MAKTIEIFISSAKEDEKLLNMLLKTLEGSLKSLKQQGLIRLWHERDIKPGAPIKLEIQKHLQTAQIILLLISIDFMHMSFCDSQEMQHLIQRHKAGEVHLIPILLRETGWEEASFGELQPLPDNGQAVSEWRNKDRAFINIAKGVRKIIDELILSAAAPSIEPTVSQLAMEEFSHSSIRHSVRKSPPLPTNGQQRIVQEVSTLSITTEQAYDEKNELLGSISRYWRI